MNCWKRVCEKTQCYTVKNIETCTFHPILKEKNVQCEKNKKHNTYIMVPLLVVNIFVYACIAETISIWHLGSVTGFLILILKTQTGTHYV